MKKKISTQSTFHFETLEKEQQTKSSRRGEIIIIIVEISETQNRKQYKKATKPKFVLEMINKIEKSLGQLTREKNQRLKLLKSRIKRYLYKNKNDYK